MEFLGLFFELVLFALGAYLYLFSRGFFKAKDPNLAEKSEAFRKDNATWMRILGLFLAAIMLVNIVLHISDLIVR